VQLQAAVNQANEQLPDYAQLCHWVRAAHDFSHATGMSTTNGRPQRLAIHQAHASALGFSITPLEVTP
jgi:hypothetical protein